MSFSDLRSPPFASLQSRFRGLVEGQQLLWREALGHRFFQGLKEFDWHSIRLGQILVASALINLLELSTPLYINIVYTTILPKQATESLLLLTIFVAAALLLAGWLKSVRLSLVGREGAQIEHRKRMNAFNKFIHIPLSRYLSSNPSSHLACLNSVNLLRDESAVQSLTIAIDLVFSLVFVLVFVMLGGMLVLPVLIGITFYVSRSLAFSRDFEAISRGKDQLDIERQGYQSQVIDSADLIKTNGLANQFLVGGEPMQERWSWQRMSGAIALGNYQAFGSFVSQVTFASVATMGALMIIGDRLMVGALAACLLLVGKIFNPWQQAMALWNSFRRLGHTWDQYDALMAEPDVSEEGLRVFEHSFQRGGFQLGLPGGLTIDVDYGGAILLSDDQYGQAVKDLFVQLIRADNPEKIFLDGLPVGDYTSDSLRSAFTYCLPSSEFFEGTLLQNITQFQPSRFEQKAYFWSVLSGLDREVSALSDGYDTVLGTGKPSGLSSDSLQLLHVISAVSAGSEVVLLDLSSCSFGKRFVEGLERILLRCKGRKTILVCGSGRILERLIPTQRLIQLSDRQFVGG